MSFTGGKLKLKGGDVMGVQKKKKKKSKDIVAEPSSEEKKQDAPKATRDGTVLEPPPPDADTRTEAERRFDEQRRKLEERQLAKLATKSHRERVQEYNQHLASLSEHHDIPKVGPG